MQRMLTIDEVCRRLKLAPRTVQRYLQVGKLTRQRSGRQGSPVLINEAEVVALEQALARQGTARHGQARPG